MDDTSERIDAVRDETSKHALLSERRFSRTLLIYLYPFRSTSTIEEYNVIPIIRINRQNYEETKRKARENKRYRQPPPVECDLIADCSFKKVYHIENANLFK